MTSIDDTSQNEIIRCLDVLQRGIVRARYLAGYPVPGGATRALSATNQILLSELLESLHNLPQYLRELLGECPPALPPSVVAAAFEQFADLMQRQDGL